jgi:hypothetical protein
VICLSFFQGGGELRKVSQSIVSCSPGTILRALSPSPRHYCSVVGALRQLCSATFAFSFPFYRFKCAHGKSADHVKYLPSSPAPQQKDTQKNKRSTCLTKITFHELSILFSLCSPPPLHKQQTCDDITANCIFAPMKIFSFARVHTNLFIRFVFTRWNHFLYTKT